MMEVQGRFDSVQSIRFTSMSHTVNVSYKTFFTPLTGKGSRYNVNRCTLGFV